MKVIWLGQAGLLIETEERKVIVDPYLSDSVKKVNPLNFRRVPVNEDFFKIRPDVIVLTHNHLDHTDPETLKKYLKEFSGITVLASENAWETVRSFGGNHNYVMFNRGTEWSEYGIKFSAVKAEHSDSFAIGAIVEINGKKLYITGDTLYNKEIFGDIPNDIDCVFLPINGVGNNMNMTDAKRFCEKLGGVKAVPIHCGMFDAIDMNEWEYENKSVPQIYMEVVL